MIHPDQTFDFIFEEERKSPTPRTFTYKHGTSLYWMEFSRKRKAILAMRARDHDDALEALMGLASERLVGMAGVNGAESIGGVLMQWELERLCESLPHAAALDEVSKKKQEFPWLFDSAPSATDAGRVGAGTLQPLSSPPTSSVVSVAGPAAGTATIPDAGS